MNNGYINRTICVAAANRVSGIRSKVTSSPLFRPLPSLPFSSLLFYSLSLGFSSPRYDPLCFFSSLLLSSRAIVFHRPFLLSSREKDPFARVRKSRTMTVCTRNASPLWYSQTTLLARIVPRLRKTGCNVNALTGGPHLDSDEFSISWLYVFVVTYIVLRSISVSWKSSKM